MLTFAIHRRGQRSLSREGEHGSVLQVTYGRHNNCESALNGFKGLQTEGPKTKHFFEIEIIKFNWFLNYNLIGQNRITGHRSGVSNRQDIENQ
jgi:hypothetical protein